MLLIDLNSAIYLAHKPEAREEPDGAGEEEECHGDHEHIGEIDEDADGGINVKLGHKVPEGAGESDRLSFDRKE